MPKCNDTDPKDKTSSGPTFRRRRPPPERGWGGRVFVVPGCALAALTTKAPPPSGAGVTSSECGVGGGPAEPDLAGDWAKGARHPRTSASLAPFAARRAQRHRMPPEGHNEAAVATKEAAKAHTSSMSRCTAVRRLKGALRQRPPPAGCTVAAAGTHPSSRPPSPFGRPAA